MIYTTLNKIRNNFPFKESFETLLKHLGKTEADDDPLPFSVIVESNGLHDALLCCVSAPEYSREWRLFAVWCARQVRQYDQRSVNAIDVAERFANGDATKEELEFARVNAFAVVTASKEAEWSTAENSAAIAATWVTAEKEDAGNIAEAAAEAAAVAAAVAAEAYARNTGLVTAIATMWAAAAVGDTMDAVDDVAKAIAVTAWNAGWNAAIATARNGGWDATLDAQTEKFLEIVGDHRS